MSAAGAIFSVVSRSQGEQLWSRAIIMTQQQFMERKEVEGNHAIGVSPQTLLLCPLRPWQRLRPVFHQTTHATIQRAEPQPVSKQ